MLRICRVAKCLTQGELAELAQLNRHTVIALEAGDRIPKSSTADALAEALGVSTATLFPEGTEPTRETPGVQAERSEANPSGQKDRDASYPSDRN